jgi:hypothetical protein
VRKKKLKNSGVRSSLWFAVEALAVKKIQTSSINKNKVPSIKGLYLSPLWYLEY